MSRYRAVIEFDGPEGTTSHDLAMELDQLAPSVNPRSVSLTVVANSPQGDRVRALLVEAGRGDLAKRVWENIAGDATVPWTDGQGPADMEETRLVLDCIAQARGQGGTSDQVVREYFIHWTGLNARTTGPIERIAE